jgi:hypothetical protein
MRDERRGTPPSLRGWVKRTGEAGATAGRRAKGRESPMMKAFVRGLAALPLLACVASASPSDSPGYVDRLEVLKTYDAYGGASFGHVGQYQVLVGIVHGRLNPNHPANAGIVDLSLAPKDGLGLVSYSTDFVILRPKEANKGKRVLFYDVVNRGNKIGLGTFNGAGSNFNAGQQGNGLLLRLGYTMVWSGWQGNVPQSGSGDTAPVGTNFPIATIGGSPVTGLSRDEFIIDAGGATLSGNTATATLSYLPATLDKSGVTFNWRPTWRTSNDPLTQGMTFTAPSTPVPESSWSYVGTGMQVQFTMPAGADQGSIFEFIYTARDPIIMGIGFAAVRDFVTFLNHDAFDRQGNANPLNDFKRAPCDSKRCDRGHNFDVTIMEGISQSGRFTRDFLWQGFNDSGRSGRGGHDDGRNGAREHGGGHGSHGISDRAVFNGMFPIIAGSRKTYTNFRFGQPGRWSKQHEDHWQPGDQFPFAYNVIRDPVSGRYDGIMKKCQESDTCPKIVHQDGAFEVFGARGSLLVTDGAGRGLRIPDNVRLYNVPGANHGGGPGVAGITQPAACIYRNSAVVARTIDRALAPALVEWVAKGKSPPDSRYPTVQDGTLALPTNQDAVGFPDLSAAGYPYYGALFNPLVVTDYSSAIPVADLSRPYKVLIGTTDEDGNEIAGVPVPEIVVPLATYTPWNVRAAGHSPGDACIANASTLPFAATRGERLANNDPRPSFEERYRSKADYVAKVRKAAEKLVKKRLLLAEDVQMYVDQAENQIVIPMSSAGAQARAQ